MRELRQAKVDLLDILNAIDKLAEHNLQAAEMVQLRYFFGIEDQELAALFQNSTASVERSMRFAKAWLTNYMAIKPGASRRHSELGVYANGGREAGQVAKRFNRFDRGPIAYEHWIPVRIPQDYLGAYMHSERAVRACTMNTCSARTTRLSLEPTGASSIRRALDAFDRELLQLAEQATPALQHRSIPLRGQ